MPARESVCVTFGVALTLVVKRNTLNWFSDDVQCLDMKRPHFISRAYVHHVGSQTCGNDAQKCMDDAEPWLRENRPELHARWYLTKGA